MRVPVALGPWGHFFSVCYSKGMCKHPWDTENGPIISTGVRVSTETWNKARENEGLNEGRDAGYGEEELGH